MVMMVSGLSPRFAPSPPRVELRQREKAFLLDCVAVSSISRDHSHSAPRAASIIPPYNPQKDRHVRAYFRTKPLPPHLKKTSQSHDGTSIHGNPSIDSSPKEQPPVTYKPEIKAGAGHCIDQVKRRSLFLNGTQPIFGYNGRYGYRRNTPPLSKFPSPFGVIGPLFIEQVSPDAVVAPLQLGGAVSEWFTPKVCSRPCCC